MPDEKISVGRIVGRDNVRVLKPFVLRETPRVLKTAVVQMIDRHRDGTLHHFNVDLYKFERVSAKVEFPTEAAAASGHFTLQGGEMTNLIGYLESLPEFADAQRGERYTVVRGDAESRVLEGQPGRVAVQALAEASEQGRLDDLLQAAQFGPGVLEHVGAAARQLQYRQEVDRLKHLVADNPTEPAFQRWVKQNYWIFGTEYVDRPDLRDIARHCQIDILLASVDGFFDVIELKRPGTSALTFDRAHDCYYPSAHLSAAIGQTVNYLQKIEDYRLIINAEDDLLLLKPRGRIVIGRSTEWDRQQHEALRKLNAAFHNIDIMTYDHLVGRGEALIRLYTHPRTRHPQE